MQVMLREVASTGKVGCRDITFGIWSAWEVRTIKYIVKMHLLPLALILAQFHV